MVIPVPISRRAARWVHGRNGAVGMVQPGHSGRANQTFSLVLQQGFGYFWVAGMCLWCGVLYHNRNDSKLKLSCKADVEEHS